MKARVTNHGSIVLVTPLDDAADVWINEHVSDDAQRFGFSLAVEPRYLAPLIEGFVSDGGEVKL